VSVTDQTTQYCTLISIVQTNGTWIGLTDLDVDVDVNGLVFVSASGYEPTDYESNVSTGVNNADISGLLGSAGFTITEATSGNFDNAEVIITLYDYGNSTVVRRIARGFWGEVKSDRGKYTAEFRALSQQLNNAICRTIQATCDAEFCDTRCSLDAATYTVTGTLTSVTSQQEVVDTSRTEADDHFRYGKLTITRGENAGISRDVKHSLATGEITFYRPFPFLPLVDDEYELIEGCDKTFTDCLNRSNQENFRGFPSVPSPDVSFQVFKK